MVTHRTWKQSVGGGEGEELNEMGDGGVEVRGEGRRKRRYSEGL